MDANYWSELFLSVLIFAPGLVVLAALAFVGLLVLIERTGLFGARTSSSERIEQTDQAANPAPGRVVRDLKASTSAHDDAARTSKQG